MTRQERLALIGFLEFLVDGSSGQHLKIYKIALSALQDKPVVRDGWKLVPIEATPDMLNASWAHHGIYHPSAYRTMVAAAPTPGGEID